MRPTIAQILLLTVFSGAVFFVSLGNAPLWDRDEPRNAGCAAEMLQRSDWVVPIFNDQLRHQKPVLLYWLIMSAYSVFGINEFGARFWSAALGVGTVLSTYVIGRRLFDAWIGCVAALALATSLMFVVAARAATPDSVLIFCSTMALMFFVLGTFRKSEPSSEPMNQMVRWFPSSLSILIPMYVSMGLGVLAKGPIGFLLPMAIIGMFGLIHNRSTNTSNASSAGPPTGPKRWFIEIWAVINPIHFLKVLWSMRPILAATLILIVSLPWYVMVHWATEGDFSQMFFFSEHFGRATVAMENHSGGVWFYPVAILIGFFPWSCFWGPTLVDVIRRCNSRTDDAVLNFKASATVFLVCWIVVQVGIFTIAKTKLPSYVTPCYPALALLTASCLVTFVRSFSSKTVKSIHPGWIYAALIGLVLSGGIISTGLWVGMGKYLPELQWLALLGLIPGVGGVALAWLLYQKQVTALVPAMTICALVFALGLFGLGTSKVGQQQQSLQLLQRVRDSDRALVGTYGCLESSWVYYGEKPIVELQRVNEEQPGQDGIDQRSRFWKPKARLTLADFQNSGTEPKMIITTDEYLEEVRASLPTFERVAAVPYFLKDRELILLSEQPTSEARLQNNQNNRY